MWFQVPTLEYLNAKLILQVAQQTLKDYSSGLHMSVKDYSIS